MPRLPAWFRPDRWVPPPGYAAGCNITRLLRASGANDYHELHRRSVAEPEWFYPAAFGDLGLGWLKPFEAVVDRAEHPSEDRWFPGGATNLGWLCADRHSRADGPAVLWEAEDGATLTMSRRELAETVRQAAAGLGSAGVRLGDVVTLVLPMIPEAVVALLAVARIGAIAAPCFSGFGPDAIAERMSLSSSRFLICADGTIRRGRPVDIRATVEAALAQLPWPVTAVEIPRLGTRATGRAVTPWARLLDHQADTETISSPPAIWTGCGCSGRPASHGLSRRGGGCTLASVEAGPPSSTFPAEPRQVASWSAARSSPPGKVRSADRCSACQRRSSTPTGARSPACQGNWC